MEYEGKDNVFAAYTTYSSQIKNFGYQLGLRAESSTYHGKLLRTGEVFDIKFPISLFPSVFLTQKDRRQPGIAVELQSPYQQA
ncbi:MAG: outer membrane beta-barrel family protein [Chitinophagaceae bacterium]|nr:outer membrane beta-barrel family protein [Chitinophagaceae bacterium]